MSIPSFGLGTFRLKGQTVIDSVSNALDLGYRAIDTAQIYGNEADVGQALSESPIARDDIYLTSKIWTDNYASDRLIPSLKDSLHKLRTDYLNLTLIHWPLPGNAVPVAEFMQALAQAQTEGLTREIGVSNFTIALMQDAMDAVGVDRIATNQIELHPYLQNKKVVAFCREHGIAVTSYMTLGYGKVLGDPVINTIAQRLQASPAQVVLAWAMQNGYAVIPSSTKRANLQDNLAARQLQLSEAEMIAIAGLDRNERITNPEGLAPAWDQ